MSQEQTTNRILASGVVIEPLMDADRVAWDEFVLQHPAGTSYHRSGWSSVIRDLYGHEVHYLMARAASVGDIVGVLPLIRLRSLLFGDFLISMPYLTYGGALAVDAEVEQSLMSSATTLAKEIGVSHIEFRDMKPRPGWTHVRTDKVAMHLNLPSSADALWSTLKTERRNRIKKPQKEGATTLVGGCELLGEFYAVYSRNMRDLGTPVYGRDFFKRILAEFPEAITLLVTRLGGKPVAGAFLFQHRDVMEIPWVSALREYNHLSVNMLLYWECLKFAISKGVKVFDFGRSSVDSGTYTFKQRWGAKDQQLYWHYWLNDGVAMPNLTPNNAKYRMAVKVWQRLPLFVTNHLGPSIVRALP